MMIQIFGTKKCKNTQKAQRFFQERGIRFQFIDFNVKLPAKKELQNIAQKTGWNQMVNINAQNYIEQGLKYLMQNKQDIERYLLKDATLIMTPIVRSEKFASCGYDPDGWKQMIQFL